ncbi:hypothetical protein [Roseibacillus persicicus]|uniref:hypothetical protein n=1 Tax=Roseibacillus persicicus TaxID=454148 RepID=UPI00280D01F2|nr:hypothetical protein [Roseibacillus persicicus]MDQ8191513.1 hypothetical protein [Roseibacillus persicicus]
MNILTAIIVSPTVRFPAILSILVAPLLLISCSTSRLVDQDRVFEPGQHAVGSLIDSDVLLEDGAVLQVDYASGNRFFLTSGSTLSGFPKGAANNTIYAEPGANYPNVRKLNSVRVVPAEDARQLFQDRFRKLLPADAESPNPGPGGTVVVGSAVGYGGYWHSGRHYNRHHHSRPPSRSVSVRPDSYRKSN